MPLDSKHLLKPDVALDALLKGSDLQQHLFEFNGRLARLNAIHGFRNELAPETIDRKVCLLGERIIGDFTQLKQILQRIEATLSGQDPFPPPPRRHRKSSPPSPIANPIEED